MTTVVDVRTVEPGVVQITMEDRAGKNMFSPEIGAGLTSAFAALKDDSTCKVVVLTGYDTYFISGGTQENLLALQEGKTKFTDASLYALPLECEVPVIAAMQGHGIGGGFVFGLFADMAILARESVYTANFMKYGFTPGFGATYIVPKKLGTALGHELLISARNYRGAELEKRGVPFPVLPRTDVVEYAHRLASEIAEKPRASLVTLKRHLTAEIRRELPSFIERELAMHDQTFHLPEVKDRIQTLFGK